MSDKIVIIDMNAEEYVFTNLDIILHNIIRYSLDIKIMYDILNNIINFINKINTCIKDIIYKYIENKNDRIDILAIEEKINNYIDKKKSIDSKIINLMLKYIAISKYSNITYYNIYNNFLEKIYKIQFDNDNSIYIVYNILFFYDKSNEENLDDELNKLFLKKEDQNSLIKFLKHNIN